MNYSISELEQFSGIQSHTIRIWEQRYNALKPMRTEGNTRLYDDEQLKKLLNIVSLNKTGLKISKICGLSNEEINTLLDKQQDTSSSSKQSEFYITQLMKFGLSYDELSFDKLLSLCINKFGMLNSYKNIMYPMLLRLGVMWRKDDICPAQEHFLSNIIKRKIYSAIDNLTLSESKDDKWLLFLPEDEEHEIGLLFANYILKANSRNVLFLGAKVPLQSIKKVIAKNDINNVLFFMVRLKTEKAAQKYLEEVEQICHASKIFFAGNNKVIENLSLGKHTRRINSLEEFENTIKNQA